MMEQWMEIVEIASIISFTDTEDYDLIIWVQRIYFSKSLYVIVNFRGVQLIYLHAVWDLKIPPRIENFLWLFSQNRVLT
jgi:hypothetical protein